MTDPNLSKKDLETYLPRLGEYLLQEGYASEENIQKALTYQRDKLHQGQTILIGQALLSMDLIGREELDRAIGMQMFDLHDALQENHRKLEERVLDRTLEIQQRLLQIRTAADITHLAVSTENIDELLQRTVDLIVERFGYFSASIFLVDAKKENMVLSHSAGPYRDSILNRGQVIKIGSDSMIGWVSENLQPKIAGDVRDEFFYRMDNLLTEIKSETCLPIVLYQQNSEVDDPDQAKVDKKVIGILDIQHTEPAAFDQDIVAMFSTICNHISAVYQNINHLDVTAQRLGELESLYSLSHQLTQVKTEEEILAILTKALDESQYPAGLMVSDGINLHLISTNQVLKNYINPDQSSISLPGEITSFPLVTAALVDMMVSGSSKGITIDLNDTATIPQPIFDFLKTFQFHHVKVNPVREKGTLKAAIFQGDRDHEWADIEQTQGVGGPILDLFETFSDLTGSALERVNGNKIGSRKIQLFEMLREISLLLSGKQNLRDLLSSIHEEVIKVVGPIHLLVAVYELEQKIISIHYAAGDTTKPKDQPETPLSALPLGQGLLSEVITSQKTLLINHNIEKTLDEFSEILKKPPAKSWLGVPLLYSNETVGILVVQDREKEDRFSNDDVKMYQMLASQLAVFLHHLVYETKVKENTERQQQLNEIRSKIRNAKNIQAVITTTADEIKKSLHLKKAKISVDVDTALHSTIIETISENEDL